MAELGRQLAGSGRVMKITDADCRSCGACCVANGDGGDVLAYGYADLTPEDVARQSRHVRRAAARTLHRRRNATRNACQATRVRCGGLPASARHAGPTVLVLDLRNPARHLSTLPCGQRDVPRGTPRLVSIHTIAKKRSRGTNLVQDNLLKQHRTDQWINER